jgi:hypothetical protein
MILNAILRIELAFFMGDDTAGFVPRLPVWAQKYVRGGFYSASHINSNCKTLHTSPLLGKDSGLIELFENLQDKSSE